MAAKCQAASVCLRCTLVLESMAGLRLGQALWGAGTSLMCIDLLGLGWCSAALLMLLLCPFHQVSPEKCRFAIGRILSEGDAKPSEEQIRRFQKYGFKIFTFPTPSHVVMASFPFTTPLSIHLAVNRVHPALDTYIKVSIGGTRSVMQ